MSIHKLNADQGAPQSAPVATKLSLQHELYDLANTILTTRAIGTFESSAARYPIYRLVRCAALRKRPAVFDDLALLSGLGAMRLGEGWLLLDGPGIFVQAKGWRNANYCSCEFGIWGESTARVESMGERLLAIVGERIDRDRIFTIAWHFVAGRSGISCTSFDEVADEEPLDEAYPSLGMPVSAFVERYLHASETVLVLQGPPGTGKTRLVRAILAGMSKLKGEAARIMYTADKKALEGDEIFVDFITGSHDAFVIEDADHLLKARSSGNHDLHRFLNVADGVARAQGRKIIFTTNLPNITDIDDALLRPGRCFASIRARLLVREEAQKLVRALTTDPTVTSAVDKLFASGTKALSIAQVYQIVAGDRRSEFPALNL